MDNQPNYSERTHYGELILMIIAAFAFGTLFVKNLADSTHYVAVEEQEQVHVNRMSLDKLRKGN